MHHEPRDSLYGRQKRCVRSRVTRRGHGIASGPEGVVGCEGYTMQWASKEKTGMRGKRGGGRGRGSCGHGRKRGRRGEQRSEEGWTKRYKRLEPTVETKRDGPDLRKRGKRVSEVADEGRDRHCQAGRSNGIERCEEGILPRARATTRGRASVKRGVESEACRRLHMPFSPSSDRCAWRSRKTCGSIGSVLLRRTCGLLARLPAAGGGPLASISSPIG